jgi:hypothetical protein
MQALRRRTGGLTVTGKGAGVDVGGKASPQLPPSQKTVHLCSSPDDEALNSEKRHHIVSTYMKTLDALKSPVRNESELPYSKPLIQKAIIEELYDDPDSEMRGHLEVGFVEIESFIPSEDFELLQTFKEACSQAEALARAGTPRDILASCRLVEQVPGDRAVRVLEGISRAMRDRFKDIQTIGSF